MRQVHRAGEKLFVDYAEQKPSFLDPAGERITAELFVVVLGASNNTYAEAKLNGRIAELIAGVPDLCAPRPRAAVRPCDSS